MAKRRPSSPSKRAPSKTRSKGGRRQEPMLPVFLLKRLMEGAYILVLSLSIYVFLSLATYAASDPSWTHVTLTNHVLNAGGRVGAYLANGLYWIFGYFAYALPVSVALLASSFLQDSKQFEFNRSAFLLRFSGLGCVTLGACALLGLNTNLMGPDGLSGAGGVIGASLAESLTQALSTQGASLLLSAIILIGITLLTGFSWIQTVEHLGLAGVFCLKHVIRFSRQGLSWIELLGSCVLRYLGALSVSVGRAIGRFIQSCGQRIRAYVIARKARVKALPVVERTTRAPLKERVMTPPPPQAPRAKIPPTPTPMPPASAPKTAPVSTMSSTALTQLPDLHLLDIADEASHIQDYQPQVLEQLSRDVEQHLLDFGIHADVVAVHPGPVITRFELQLAAGIKVSRLSALSKDLARALSVVSVRIVEVIPGKTVVGLELPNPQRAMVRLSRIFSAEAYQQAHSLLTLALGVDIAGYPVVVDLAKMPHLLVAGTTGSGKSVGINAMILSLLFRATPDQVRLIMIDPKMLELSVYEGIPHLLAPVVTDMREAASALRWCVAEMERRYRLLAALGMRNLASYNAKITEAAAQGSPLIDPLSPESAALEPLPYVVVVIDELADMMMVVGKKVEQLIARIAQKARAAGIHLILATQRPSVDVLTGLIKSNIPTRISFQVSSKIDSRTILDQQGAEQLLGHGDMLFLSPGGGTPLRVHGAFVDDAEVHRVADALRQRGEPQYIEAITQCADEESGGDDGAGSEADSLYDEVVEFVIDTKKSSISAIQRRFKVGYNRAARLVETMEEAGVLGPMESGGRDVLVSKD